MFFFDFWLSWLFGLAWLLIIKSLSIMWAISLLGEKTPRQMCLLYFHERGKLESPDYWLTPLHYFYVTWIMYTYNHVALKKRVGLGLPISKNSYFNSITRKIHTGRDHRFHYMESQIKDVIHLVKHVVLGPHAVHVYHSTSSFPAVFDVIYSPFARIFF